MDKAEISKKNNKQGHLQARKFKKEKKKEIIIYDLVLAFNKQESFIENENKRPKKIRTLSLIKILQALIRKCNVQGFFTKFMQIYAGLGF